MSDIGPKKEPVAWATLITLAIAAFASYGLSVTPELQAFIVAGATAAAAWWARSRVTPTPKAEQAADEQYIEGYSEGVEKASRGEAAAIRVPREQWGVNQGRYGTTVGALYRAQGERVAE